MEVGKAGVSGASVRDGSVGRQTGYGLRAGSLRQDRTKTELATR